MYKVDLWVWVDRRTTQEDQKYYAYCLEMGKQGRTYRRSGDGEIEASWNRATLTAIAEALERFHANSEVVIHTENRWVLNMIANYLQTWEGADFWKNKKEKVAHEAEWRRIAKKMHGLLLTGDPMGFDQSEKLQARATQEET